MKVVHWGVTGSVTPWKASGVFKGLLEAQAVSLSGQELRIGVTRGWSRGGEWSIMFVRKTVNEGGTLTDAFGQRYVMGSDIVLTGGMIESYDVLASGIHDRVQLGLVLGAGLAKAEGSARQIPDGKSVAAKTVLTFFAKEAPMQFLGRVELAIAVAIAPGTKIRVSGGFDWPGQTRIGVTMLYFFGEK